MPNSAQLRNAFCVVVCFLMVFWVASLAGCDSGRSTPSLRTPLPTVSPATPSPSPSSPNVKQIDVVAIGLGAYDLAVIPVALLHNESTQNAALGISVTFTVGRRGGTSPRTVPSDVTYDIPPGGTVAVTADCTDACLRDTSVTVVPVVGNWGDASSAPSIAVSAISSSCVVCGSSGSGHGQASAAVSGELIPRGSLVSVEAACYRGTHIVGGGEHLVDWGAPGGPLQVVVATVVSIRPSRCLVTATLTS